MILVVVVTGVLCSISWWHHEKLVRYCAFAQGVKYQALFVVDENGKPIVPYKSLEGDIDTCAKVGETL
mgnify:CR=1 FL=1